jgi:mannose-1-phosphate guanylyltransferase/mannose-6-phosphate isomerase
VGEWTLFQQSISRAVALENNNIQIEEILIVTNENHRFLVLNQLDELKLNVPTRILLEPEPKNTAPALTLAALTAQITNPDSILVVTPSDHYVKDLQKFTQAMHEAIKSAQDKTIVTIGIIPTRPSTGFGYVHYEGNGIVKNVLSFKEKPTLAVAEQMIEQGQHSWNGGIFILQSKTWLDAIEQSNPEIFKSINEAWKNKNIDQWFERPDEQLFKKSTIDSIDYAVMEKAKVLNIDLKLVVLDAGWSDLGTFEALDEIEDKDQDGNIFKGDVLALNAQNIIAISSKKNISLLGVENLIVIETADSVLVANKNDGQLIKELAKLLEKNHQSMLSEHKKVNRPWGWFETVDEGSNFKVKRISVNPNSKLSYQSHKYRSEHWVVVKGQAEIIQDGKIIKLVQDQSTYIKKGSKHQLINNTQDYLEIIEIQTGSKVTEDDIVRFNDIYGR